MPLYESFLKFENVVGFSFLWVWVWRRDFFSRGQGGGGEGKGWEGKKKRGMLIFFLSFSCAMVIVLFV